MSRKSRNPLRLGWLLLALGTLATVAMLIFGFQKGMCVDYVSPAAGQSTCTSGPAVGTFGAVILGGAGLALAAYALARAFRSPSESADDPDTRHRASS